MSPDVCAPIRAARRIKTFAVKKLSKPASWAGESELYLS